MRCGCFRALGVLLALYLVPFDAHASLSTQVETDYADALLAYHSRQYRSARTILTRALTMEPGARELLELKALVLEADGDTGGAIATYQRLLTVPSGGSGGASRGAYLYRLGAIYAKQSRFEQARNSLEEAVRAGFTAPQCRYLLGVLDRKQGLLADARAQFGEVVASDAVALKPAAAVQLAQIASIMSDPGTAVREYAAARSLASRSLSDRSMDASSQALARQVMTLADKELRTYDESVLLVNAGLLTAYDSNVLSTADSAIGAGGKAPGSLEQLLQYGIAYVTSPLSSWQVVPSYRGNLNYTMNQATKAGEFFSHDVSVFVTKGPLDPTRYGVKLEAIGMLQYQTDATSGKGKFGAYNLTGSVGPYVKTDLDRHWTLGADLFFQPQKWYLDQYQADTARKSGWDQLARVYVALNEPGSLWNPAVYLTADYTQTTGSEFQSRRVELAFADTLYFSQRLVASAVLSLAGASFPNRPGSPRSDQTFGLSTSGGYRLSDGLTALASIQYLQNFSSVSTYRFQRVFTSLGVNYVF